MEIKHKSYFINFVRDGTRISAHSLTKKVGSGSSKHDFVAEEVVILKTSPSLAAVKLSKWAGDLSGHIGRVNCVVKVSPYSGDFVSEERTEHISQRFVIFSLRKNSFRCSMQDVQFFP